MAEALPAQVDALNIVALEGAVPFIDAPIPRWSAIALGVLQVARLVEWLAVDDEAGALTLCGHDFRVVAWHDGAHALIVKHACCL
jgi:hypothetical protein